MDSEKLKAALLSGNAEVGEGQKVLIPCKIDLGEASFRVYIETQAYSPDDVIEKAVELLEAGWTIDVWKTRQQTSAADKLSGGYQKKYYKRY